MQTIQAAVAAAVRRLSAIPFFPPDADAREEIMNALEDMIGAETLYGSTPQERLDWLVTVAVNAMRQWGGIPELRGLLCSKWKPADRIEAYSSLPGYSGEDSESLAIAEHRNRKAIEAGKASPKLLEAAECDRLSSDEVQQLRRDMLGALIATTKFPTEHTKSLADEERELAEAPRRVLTEEQKALRLAALQAGLKAGGQP